MARGLLLSNLGDSSSQRMAGIGDLVSALYSFALFRDGMFGVPV